MLKSLVVLTSAVILVVACDHDQVSRAIVVINGKDITGNVTFEQTDGLVRVSGRIVGLPPGLYGFHVHEKGDLSGGCATAGGHYNPNGKEHGHPDDENRHVGDLGNIRFDDLKVADIDFTDRQLKLSGHHNIIGRSVVLHERNDDYGRSQHPDSKKTGNAGGRVACGVIGIL